MRKLFLLGFGAFCLLGVRVARANDTDVDDDDFRPDVMLCEQALGKLVQCCGGFQPAEVTCTYRREQTSDRDFNTSVVETPSFTEDESRCILAASCDVLLDGVCLRAQKAPSYVFVDQDSPDSPAPSRAPSSHAPVCP